MNLSFKMKLSLLILNGLLSLSSMAFVLYFQSHLIGRYMPLGGLVFCCWSILFGFLLGSHWSQPAKVAIFSPTQIEEELSEVEDILQQIAEQASVVDEIFMQSKTLLKNWVEATKAGDDESGHVLAREVGLLATYSGQAASHLGEYIFTASSRVDEITGKTKQVLRERKSEGLNNVVELATRKKSGPLKAGALRKAIAIAQKQAKN